jgi:Zn-dependent protease with chaperone function
MRKKWKLITSFSALLVLALPSAWGQDRAQNFVVSQSAAHSTGSAYFAQIKAKARDSGSLIEQGPVWERVRRIASDLIRSAAEYRPEADSWAWEFALIRAATKNAACLPGGKVIIYTGLIEDLALSDDEIAAVLGHEIGHALREHGREKSSNTQIAKAAVGILAIVAGAYGVRKNLDVGTVMDATQLLGSVLGHPCSSCCRTAAKWRWKPTPSD